MAHIVDQELLTHVSNAIQAQERLQLALRSRKDYQYWTKVYPEVCQALNSMRDVKSVIEGTSVISEPVVVRDDVLQELKPYVLKHVPMSLTSGVKHKIKELVIKAFNGTCKNILYIGLVTCPWYCATQTDRGLQAKYNHLLVLYKIKDHQLFLPLNSHPKEKSCDVIDKGWFYAIEVSHFGHYLVRGKVRFVEALYMPDSAVIFCSKDWDSLRTFLRPTNCLMLKGFLEQCCGQALGSVSKKCKRRGQMKLRDGTTLHDFCDSFRLLHHATMSLLDHELCLENFSETSLSPMIVEEAMLLIKESYQTESCNKAGLHDVVMKWYTQVKDMMTKCRYTPITDVQKCIEQWLIQVRTEGKPLTKPKITEECEREPVEQLLSQCIGGPTSAMEPDNVIMIARAGSHLYGLSTSDSDIDYVIIYANPTEKVLSSCQKSTECAESRGPQKTVEYGTYEVRLFCEMLWKGSVIMLELIFAEMLDYTSPVWKDFVSKKELFVTEQAILQYIGLIRNNMADIEMKRYIGTKRECKVFYQILHKLYCLEFLIKGECPKIKCDKATREFILKVRKGPLQGEIARDRLYEDCRNKLDSLRKHLSNRETRLPENINYEYLTKWLLQVRGYPFGS